VTKEMHCHECNELIADNEAHVVSPIGSECTYPDDPKSLTLFCIWCIAERHTGLDA